MLLFVFINYCLYLRPIKACLAGVVELVDTLDLGSSAATVWEFESPRPH